MAKQRHQYPKSELAQHKAMMVALANKNLSRLNGCGIDEIRQLVDAHEVVFGVWQDLSEPDGIGSLIIKGQQILRVVAASNGSKNVSLTAIPCSCIEEAMAFHQVVGEPDRRH